MLDVLAFWAAAIVIAACGFPIAAVVLRRLPSVAEAVDHVEDRVQMRDGLPEGGQRMDRVEHARQERERHDDEVLERRKLVELVGPDPRNHPERTENAAAQKSEHQHPPGMHERHAPSHQSDEKDA